MVTTKNAAMFFYTFEGLGRYMRIQARQLNTAIAAEAIMTSHEREGIPEKTATRVTVYRPYCECDVCSEGVKHDMFSARELPKKNPCKASPTA